MTNNPKSDRLESLDALRGFDMLWIIGGEAVVKNLAKAGNSGFLDALSRQLEHVPWDGFHFYDLIMPLFLFMAGMSIPFSTGIRLEKGELKNKIYLHALKRWVILLILGMIYEGNLLALDIHNIYFGSVLGAIGIGYFFSVLIYSMFNFRSQILITASILAAYWIILTFIPVPGQKAGVLLPQLNIARYCEHLFFGRFAKPDVPYMWFLDTGGFICTVMSGVLAGTILRGNFRIPSLKSSGERINKVILLILAGSILVSGALLLKIWFPVIKMIWNPTFILLTSGLSFLLIALFYFLIDVKGYRRWAFWLKVIGMNSITVYLGVHFIPFGLISKRLVFGLEQFIPVYYPVIESLCALVIIYTLLYWMYKKGTFLKI